MSIWISRYASFRCDVSKMFDDGRCTEGHLISRDIIELKRIEPEYISMVKRSVATDRPSEQIYADHSSSTVSPRSVAEKPLLMEIMAARDQPVRQASVVNME